MYKILSLRAIFLIVSVLSLSACHLVKQMDGMAENTEHLKTGTEKVRQTSDELYDALRQGSSLELRTQLFKSLLESESTGRKIAEAVHYLMAFEYQLYTGFARDTDLAKRDKLMGEATQEFFMSLKDIYVVTDKVDPLAQGNAKEVYSNANKEASFNAMAMGIHMLNRKQEENVKNNPGMEAVSMYSMISHALVIDKEVSEGRMKVEEVPVFAKHVLNNKRMAIKILQARQMMVKVVFLGETSPLLEGTTKLTKIYKFGSMNLAGWDLKLNEMPATQVQEFNHLFSLMQETRDLLSTIAVEPQTNYWVERMLRKMQVPEIKDSGDLERKQLGSILTSLKGG